MEGDQIESVHKFDKGKVVSPYDRVSSENATVKVFIEVP